MIISYRARREAFGKVMEKLTASGPHWRYQWVGLLRARVMFWHQWLCSLCLPCLPAVFHLILHLNVASQKDLVQDQEDEKQSEEASARCGEWEPISQKWETGSDSFFGLLAGKV